MRVRFDHYVLDVERRELSKGPALVQIQPQVFDLLVYIIKNRDRVVSKDDLITAIWNGRIVSESTLITRINAARRAIGDDGEQQRLIRTVARKGVRFVGAVCEVEAFPAKALVDAKTSALETVPSPKVTFCTTNDGVRLAIATVGEGPTLVRAAHWITQIEAEWQNPLTAPFLRHLAGRTFLVRYDTRGTGLSDRNVPEISFARARDDLETVIETLKLDRFALFGQSGGAAVAIDYAARHPDRVSKLVLLGGYALGRNKRSSQQNAEEANAFLTMLRSGWGNEHSIFWRAFSSFFLPKGTPEQLQWFLDLQLKIFTPDTVVPVRKAVDDIDVADLLSRVKAPTIVFHSMRDNLVPFEQGRLLAASIPNARFVPIDSDNHFLLSNEPAWSELVSKIDAFLQ